MSLEEQIKAARHEIITDGYDMSIGEIMNLYEREEIVINPIFQRYFRWEASQKTRFIESILLGIPVPPIFVFQREDGIWELIDGLQRLSTLFEFAGILRDSRLAPRQERVLDGTKALPALAGKHWEPVEGQDPSDALASAQRLEVKRARMRVEILKEGSSADAKFELFQRLNTGGSALAPQEVRNCVMVMIDPSFHEWLKDLAADPNFVSTVNITDAAKERQLDMELALRFVVFHEVPYRPGLDVHEYLDDAAVQLAQPNSVDRSEVSRLFRDTFQLINVHLGADAFRRFDGQRFLGQFLMSAFEVVAVGVATNLKDIAARADVGEFLKGKVTGLWSEDHFRTYSGAGVRGTTRLSNLLPWAPDYFAP
jgi:hypothetical protein